MSARWCDAMCVRYSCLERQQQRDKESGNAWECYLRASQIKSHLFGETHGAEPWN